MCPSLVVANRDPLVFGGADKTLYRALEFDPSRDNLDKMQIFAVQDSAIIAGNAPRGW